MPFLYETHMHTCTSSKCGRSTGAEHARYYKSLGYTGIIITDHFYGGNTGVDRSLPWDKYVDGFWRGYEEAGEEGDKIGLDVFFGLEQNILGDEYLIYGLSKEYMKSRPDMRTWSRKQQFDEVHAAGGCVIQAHPFRIRGYMDKIRLGLLFCDGVEVANCGNEPLDDARCKLYAEAYHLMQTAGSDNHRSPADEGKIYGIALEHRLTCIQDFVRLILSHGSIGLHVPQERFVMPEPATDERHIAWLLDEKEQEHVSPRQWMGQ